MKIFLNKINRLSIVVLGLLLLAGGALRAEQTESYRKPDLAGFFAKLEAGQTVTVVALGGSITMEPNGWARQIVARLRNAYPKVRINFVNAGISGTGSDFGLFRLDRDVISMHPDLVFVEYAVNDSSIPDQTCVRNLESIVVRLQSLPSPPAIVFVESAAEQGSNRNRHHLIASHYGLLEVDMQPVVNAHLTQTKGEWKTLFRDHVHPNAAGHQLYTQTLWQALMADRARPEPEGPLAPVAPLTDGDLILDGALVVPNFQGYGWNYQEEEAQGWWRKFFQGSLQSSAEAAPFSLPFYGRTLGVALLTLNGSGKLRLEVDGKAVGEIDAGSSNWFYNIYVCPELFDDGWHVLRLVPIGEEGQAARVRIGYLLTENQGTAPE
jgi:lysophospholipase L1-like esterase